jgi:hypothetical protein
MAAGAMVVTPARIPVTVVVAEMVEDAGMGAIQVLLKSVRKTIIDFAIASSAG